ncbi:MAG: hypothetical protein COA36_12610 [Desulfotalea sp.]|nr:MAG: hypothetical protein COA36_12610 [Desulfotalea sp.]
MLKRATHLSGIFSLAIAMAIATPLITKGEDTGQDWYCSNPKAHAQYEKHLIRHLNHAAEAITEKLDKIYSDPALSQEEKKTQTMHVLEWHLAKMQDGQGD